MDIKAKYVLVVEKDAIWQRLNEDQFWKKENCIIMTPVGQASRGTRRMIRKLADKGLPVYVFTDSDAWGWYIYWTIKAGSINLAYIGSDVATPEAKFIGMSMSDIEKYDFLNKLTINASDMDTKRRPGDAQLRVDKAAQGMGGGAREDDKEQEEDRAGRPARPEANVHRRVHPREDKEQGVPAVAFPDSNLNGKCAYRCRDRVQAYSVVGNESRSRGSAIARTKDEVQHSQVLHSLLRPDFELNKSIKFTVDETGLHLDIQKAHIIKISVDGKSLSNAEKHSIDLTSKNTLLLEVEDSDKTKYKLSLKITKLDQENLTEDHRAKLAQALDEKVKDAVMGRDFPDEDRWLSHMVDLKAAAENLGIRTFRFETGTKLRASYEGALPGKETSLGQTISISNEIYEQRTLDFLKTLRGGVDEELGVLGGLTQNLSVMEAAEIKKARLFDVNPFEIFTQLRQIEAYNKTATYVDAGNNTHALPEGEIKIIWENTMRAFPESRRRRRTHTRVKHSYRSRKIC